MLSRNTLWYPTSDFFLAPPNTLQLQTVATSFCFCQITYLSDLLFLHHPQPSARRHSSASPAYHQPQLHPPSCQLCFFLDTNTIGVLSCWGIFNDSKFSQRTNLSWSLVYKILDNLTLTSLSNVISPPYSPYVSVTAEVSCTLRTHVLSFSVLVLLFWSPSSGSWALAFRWISQF